MSGERLPRPLSYAALLACKSEATDAIKRVMARVRDEHANLPSEFIFRIHSDQGGEFATQELDEYCKLHAINKTTTQGHDPNANATAESAVGVLKRRCRYLLSGARFPTKFGGVGILAVAHLERCDVGHGIHPKMFLAHGECAW